MDDTLLGDTPGNTELINEINEILIAYMYTIESEWNSIVALECSGLYASPSAEEPDR